MIPAARAAPVQNLRRHCANQPCSVIPIPTPQVPCPESFADAYCAIASEVPALTAACDTKPWCTTINVLLGASMGVRITAGPVGSPIGVLKAVNESVSPHQLCYSPFSALYMQQGKVPPLPQPQPTGQPAGAASSPPPAPGATLLPPAVAAAPLPTHDNTSWSILLRHQAELRQVDNGEAGFNAMYCCADPAMRALSPWCALLQSSSHGRVALWQVGQAFYALAAATMSHSRCID